MKKENSIYIIVLSYLVMIVIIITTSILLSGCYTQKRAAKQFHRAAWQYPDIANSYCANKFDDNVIPVYIPGDTVTLTDTVTVDCGDSVIIRSVNKLVKVPVTVYKFRVDTFTRIIENKAELAAKQSQIDNMKADYNKETGKTKTLTLFGIIAGILVVVLAVLLGLCFKF